MVRLLPLKEDTLESASSLPLLLSLPLPTPTHLSASSKPRRVSTRTSSCRLISDSSPRHYENLHFSCSSTVAFCYSES